ncbi:angiopoietin-1-like isoform X2 [Mya arenaria]|uniref:angiopoietin-1-like isoform X2 n=1 Tax=Mya arenaria TaxID=6604 RepID=UPI0022DF23B6|nr:angiopoietin-1-like isoform X2 [Mya arenaria]
MAVCKANMLFVILTSYTVLLNRCANTNELLMQTFSKVLSLDNEFRKSHASLDERMDKLEIKLENSLSALQTQLTEGLERIAQTQKNYEPKLGGITNNFQSTISNTVTQMMKSQYTAINTAMKQEKVALMSLKTEMKNHMKNIDDEFQNAQSSLDERLANQTNAMDYKLERHSKSYKSSSDSIKSDLRSLTSRVSSIENMLPVDGQWANWMGWTKCDTRCKTGQMYRLRECNNPAPLYGGASCPGEDLEIRDGQWGIWMGWTNCVTHCEKGKQFRTRECNNPAPRHGGSNCTGDGTEIRAFADCSEIRQNLGSVPSGVYHITTWKTNQHAKVFCDMDTDQGGWTVFQHRVDGSVDFYRNFSSYENGFGSLQGEFWLGLKLMHEMTSRTTHDLRIDITRANDSTAYIVYADFSVGAGSNYTLHVGDALSERGLPVVPDRYQFNSYANGSAFSTFDHDNDHSWSNCAVDYHGAWWYRNCIYLANLNGLYYTPGTYVSNRTAMIFDSFESLKTSRMMFRPSV